MFFLRELGSFPRQKCKCNIFEAEPRGFVCFVLFNVLGCFRELQAYRG